jgi:hypothetical protein
MFEYGIAFIILDELDFCLYEEFYLMTFFFFCGAEYSNFAAVALRLLICLGGGALRCQFPGDGNVSLMTVEEAVVRR